MRKRKTCFCSREKPPCGICRSKVTGLRRMAMLLDLAPGRILMRHDLAMSKQNASRSRSTRVADCSIWKLPSSRAGATARSARCVQGVRQQRCQPGVGPEDEYRQRWRQSGMAMLLSKFASVGGMPHPLLLCCGILCRCADNSSCGEALGRARDGRTRFALAAKSPSPQLAHRCIAEASRQEASHGSLHFT